MSLWWVLILGGLLTYAIRLSFIIWLGKVETPDWLSRSLRFVPPAVLSAIVLPELLLHSGEFDLSTGNLRMLAGMAAALVAWKTKSALLTIAAGMAALYFLQWLS